MEENQNTSEPGHADYIIPQQPTESPMQMQTPPPLAAQENKSINSDPDTQNSKPENDSMEVHKHPHHVMHKKKWNEYLLEFFMLFLAVFLGFVAENIRENISEHEREKKFAGRLLSDLRQDSSIYQKSMQEFRQRKKRQMDFFRLMSGARKPTDSAVISSFLSLFLYWSPQFTTATYNQMKMSGSLRYIQNDQLTTELQKYYDTHLPEIDREIADVRKVFTDRILPYMIAHFKLQDLADTSTIKYAILNRTGNSDQELTNIMGAYGAGWDAVFGLYERDLRQDQTLIGMIKEDYHLK